MGVASSAYLNLVADSLHNFTDGLAIGASYASGHGLGLATTLSILFHEVPHEIADFTILVQSGFTIRAAILAQFGTAIASLVGTVIGLLSQFQEGAEHLLLAITTGGFLYVATVSLLPALIREKSSLKQSICEVVALLIGISVMSLVEH